MPIIANDSWRPLGNEEPIFKNSRSFTRNNWIALFPSCKHHTVNWSLVLETFSDLCTIPFICFIKLCFLTCITWLSFLIEPWLGNRETAWTWSVLFVIFAILCFALGRFTVDQSRPANEANPNTTQVKPISDAQHRVQPAQWLRWVALSAIGSALLLGVSSHLTQNISSAPLLWVVPLSLYLITFIISFDHPRWYLRALYLPLAIILVPLMAWLSDSLNLKLVTPIYACGLFVVCMVCHGELARLKPHPQN